MLFRPAAPDSINRPRDNHDINITGTLNVLEAARAQRVKRVLLPRSLPRQAFDRACAQGRILVSESVINDLNDFPPTCPAIGLGEADPPEAETSP